MNNPKRLGKMQHTLNAPGCTLGKLAMPAAMAREGKSSRLVAQTAFDADARVEPRRIPRAPPATIIDPDHDNRLASTPPLEVCPVKGRASNVDHIRNRPAADDIRNRA
ncbi:hypothetical protein MesoLjLb_54530 [Mesorhizobium sp. L-8-3]|nr:hypothetical protein MesoLjLb_54530 [Mesorhizobium sp. L-8-3]